MEQAACRGMDPAIFFPERGQPCGPAQAVCAKCPVREDCWEYSVETAAKHGIWGGMSERARRDRRRSEKISLLGRMPTQQQLEPPSHSRTAIAHRKRRAAEKQQREAG